MGTSRFLTSVSGRRRSSRCNATHVCVCLLRAFVLRSFKVSPAPCPSCNTWAGSSTIDPPRMPLPASPDCVSLLSPFYGFLSFCVSMVRPPPTPSPRMSSSFSTVMSNFRGKYLTLVVNVREPAVQESVSLDGETSDVLTAEYKRERESLKLEGRCFSSIRPGDDLLHHN